MTDHSECQLWPSCGYQYLAVNDANQLEVGDEFLRFFYHRPELEPGAGACEQERALHAALLEHPRRVINDAEIQALADSDAQENYHFMRLFRDLLLQYQTIERAYLALTSGQTALTIPAVLLDLLVQITLRHILNDTDNAYAWRAGELLFRRQRVGIDSGIMLADAELLARRRPAAMSTLQSLISQAGGVSDNRETLDVLNHSTLDRYWQHSEAFDLVISLNYDEPSVGALCWLWQEWIRHFHDAETRITPLREIHDDHWRWHIGLDAESNRLLNRLYQGDVLDDIEQQRLLALFKLEFVDASLLQPTMVGYPIYLGLAMNADYELRVKPQNILLNLPLAAPI